LLQLRSAFRRTGADLPGGDPRPTHDAEMEGWFWRFTDPTNGRVVVALCGINRHPDGAWATLAIAAHPDRVTRAAAVPGASASETVYEVVVPHHLDAGAGHVRTAVDDVELDVVLSDLRRWPLRLGGGGVFSTVPWLSQYWHPHVLGGRANGTVSVGGERYELRDAGVYAEKNWGAGFPTHWWWGEAHDFDDGADVCVAFGGGHLRAGPIGTNVGGCVIRLGDRVVRFAPPTALVRSHVDLDTGRWSVVARRPGWRLDVEGDGDGRMPHVLPVPVPSERRNIDTDLEHLAGRMTVTLQRKGDVVYRGTSHLAGLEVGTTDDRLAARQRAAFAPARVEGHV